jgi:hypothetical protein
MTPNVHALALKARDGLAPDELALVSPLIRERLANPFAFLRMEFDKAWDAAEPGRAIEFLSKSHTTSLSVLAPTHTGSLTLTETGGQVESSTGGDPPKSVPASRARQATRLRLPGASVPRESYHQRFLSSPVALVFAARRANELQGDVIRKTPTAWWSKSS